jgi:hypothetical protein
MQHIIGGVESFRYYKQTRMVARVERAGNRYKLDLGEGGRKCDNIKNPAPCGQFVKILLNGVEDVRFEVFTVVTMKNVVFWDVTQCGSCKNRRFGGT